METIDIFINNYDEIKSIARGTKLYTLISPKDTDKFVAAKVNNVVTSLSYSLKVRASVTFVTAETTEGMEVYRRSLSFLLSKTVSKFFPRKELVIMHSLGPGYYYELMGQKLTKEDISTIENSMKEQIKHNIPIVRGKMSFHEAIDVLKKENSKDKISLLTSLNNPIITYYQCENYFEMIDAPLASHTGLLKVFAIIPYESGFILQFPKRSNLSVPSKFIEQRKIFEVYKKHKELGKSLEADNVGALNRIITTKKIKEFIQIEEAMQESRIIELAELVVQKKDNIRLITIAGPSSSGKTTFSKRLELQLKGRGLKTKTISVDNYFVDRDQTPIDEEGNYNYESLHALNLELFNEHISALLNGQRVQMAAYNFLTGLAGLSDNYMEIEDNEIIIIEGIHCLNEELTYTVSRDNKFKIYLSPLTQMNIDNVNRIPTTDNRVIRRLVRDYRYRGHSAERTLSMWPSVRLGEEHNIFPFQNDADGYFNSSLDYELSILKSYAEPILMQIPPDSSVYGEARRLLRFLSYFLCVPADYVPPSSILREFIGGSFFNY